MYNNIMIPLDGSLTSESALSTAVDLARRSGATLHVVQVTGSADYADATGSLTERGHLQTLAARATRDSGVVTIVSIL